MTVAVEFPVAKSRTGTSDAITRVVIYVALAMMLVYLLLPVFWMIKSSFQSNFEIQRIPPLWLPSDATWKPYENAGLLIPMWRYIFNSLFVSAVTAIVASGISCTAAYVLVVCFILGILFSRRT